MRFNSVTLFLVLCLSIALTGSSFAQSGNRQRYPKTKPNAAPNEPAQKEAPAKDSPQQGQKQPEQHKAEQSKPDTPAPSGESIKIDTDLVTVPVIASDYND